MPFKYITLQDATDVEPLFNLFAVGVVKHGVHDVLGQLGLVGVGGPAHPGVNDALVIRAFERHLKKNVIPFPSTSTGVKRFDFLNLKANLEYEAELGVEIAGVGADLDGPERRRGKQTQYK